MYINQPLLKSEGTVYDYFWAYYTLVIQNKTKNLSGDHVENLITWIFQASTFS